MLEQSFTELCLHITSVRGALRAVQVAAAKDEAITEEVGGLVGMVDEILLGAQRARSATRLPVNIDVVRRALPRCQRQFSQLKTSFCVGVSAPANLQDLRNAGHRETAWYLERCVGPLFAVERALSVCWLSVGDYSVQHPGGVIPGIPPP